MDIIDTIKHGTIYILILALLQREDMYSYQLCEAIKTRSKQLFDLQEGQLYPPLFSLLKGGFLSERKEQLERRTRIYYHLEPRGRELLERLLKEYRRINRGAECVIDSTEF